MHSHEEDTDDEIVYRSATSGYEFPRSRGREALELHPDGSYGGVVPGPADKPGRCRGGHVGVGGRQQARVAGPDAGDHRGGAGGVLRVRRPR